ncbi:MAG: Sirohydrochlorin cobaltochelatase [Hydrogenibacillus schlegelii]|uniref:Sirohydrochlorin cobaltochelatase n=1 Tax=Hydrogenibacillus schlegelii TaxID=1484 RepID=A0A2T5GBS5_HYDSH|nr:sirohydrochlorin chelatase [Hydrogenibacillus schlegelii]PTQ53625.1 MAG: Sirohydrochlorin cobaltochelatase [Hydrogenibacillus schlegelii]
MAMTASRTAAVLFVGHGTRFPKGRRAFLKTAADAATRLGIRHFEAAFLEFCPPTVANALHKLYRSGVREVLIVPLLLFAAGHGKQDLPSEVDRAREACPGLRARFAPVFGEDPRLVALAAARALKAAGRFEAGDALLVVGRGSRDVEAFAAFRRVAEAIRRALGVERWGFGMLTGIGPGLEEAAARLRAQSPRRTVVLPYLLFEGYLMRKLPERLNRALSADRASVAIARPLGPHPLLSAVLADRVREGMDGCTGRRKGRAMPGLPGVHGPWPDP